MSFSTFAAEVGKNVRRARWAAGLTLEDVAEITMTYRRLSELENGRGNPTMETLYSLADALDVRVEDLMNVGQVPKAYVRLADREAEPPKLGRRSNK